MKRIILNYLYIILTVGIVTTLSVLFLPNSNIKQVPINESSLFTLDNDTLSGVYINDSIIYIVELDMYINWTQSGRVTKLPD